MNTNTLKSIKLFYMVLFCFSCSCFFSFSNLFAIDYFRQEYIVKQNYKEIERVKSEVNKCRESRRNNFKDRSPTERTILIYLNTLLDQILSNNSDILNKFERSSSEFCVDICDRGVSEFDGFGMGLIKINWRQAYTSIRHDIGIYDSHIVAMLSHEIAHDLLDHIAEIRSKKEYIYDTSTFKNEYIFINEYNPNTNTNPVAQQNGSNSLQRYDDVSNLNSKLNEEYKKWEEFYSADQDFIKLRRRQEIDADNLGLSIYIHTGLKAIEFGKHYIENTYHLDIPLEYPVITSLVKGLAMKEGSLTESEEKIKEEMDEVVESKKYDQPTDYHPSDFWRYWNTIRQIEKYKKKNPTDVNACSNLSYGFYFKVDLSRSNRLGVIKKIWSEHKNDFHTLISGKHDLRLIIIEQILSGTLNYTLEFIPYEITDVGRVREDNTMLLRANDIFRISLIKEKKTSTVLNVNGMCVPVFSTDDEEFLSTRDFDAMIYEVVVQAFL